MFNNSLTTVISHYCIFTEALTCLTHHGFQLLLSLQWSKFSPHCSKFTEIMIGKNKVLPYANDQIVSSGSVPHVGQDIVTFSLHLSFPHLIATIKVKTFIAERFQLKGLLKKTLVC